MNSKIIDKQFATFKPEGYISAANSDDFLEQLMDAIKSSGNSSLLIDMKQVEFMDSAGLMALIEAFRLAKEMDRDVNICSVAPPVRMLFELTQLDNVFNIFENKDSFATTAIAA